jgi:hypothetical protein
MSRIQSHPVHRSSFIIHRSTMPTLPITRVVLYKHGVGYFEREGSVEGDAPLTFTFAQSEVSDVLKSLTVLDLHGGHIDAVSYDSTKPLEQRLADIALTIPDQNSLTALLPQLKGARVAIQPGAADESFDCTLLGVDAQETRTAAGVARTVYVSVLTDDGDLFSYDLHALAGLQLRDDHLRRDLDYYLRTQLAAKKQEARTFTFFATGRGKRTVRLSYVVGAPVWKATYRLLLPEPEALATGTQPTIQGWAVVDNTQDEDWEQVALTLVAGLPVSFVHDLYTPRYVRRPEVRVQETTGVLPPEIAAGIRGEEMAIGGSADTLRDAAPPAAAPAALRKVTVAYSAAAPSSVPTQVRERQVGDLFEYHVERPVTIRRDQSALVPIVLKPFDGRPVLLYQREAREQNPLRAVEFKNTTGLTLEGGPVTVIESSSYVGEAMLDTMKPDEERIVPYAVELSVRVLVTVDSRDEKSHRFAVRNGTLKSVYYSTSQTTYTFASRSRRNEVAFLDHLRHSDASELFDTPAPHEMSERYWRFKFVLTAGETTHYVVKSRKLMSQTVSISDARSNVLSYWLEERGGRLDPNVREPLQRLVELQRQAAGTEERIQRLEKERNDLSTEQGRIRENLTALGDKPTERNLRERLVTKLNAQEDRLEAIAAELHGLADERDRARTGIGEVLAGLEYEGPV